MALFLRIYTFVFVCLSLLWCLVPHFGLAFPYGAPATTCYSLEPSHGSSRPQTSQFPYTITVDKLVLVDDGLVRVTIAPAPTRAGSGSASSRQPQPRPTFKGFLVIAQPVNRTIDDSHINAGDIRSGDQRERPPPVSEWPQKALERSVGRLKVATEGIGARALKCGDAPDSGITHSDSGEKTELVLEWTPAGVDNGDYVLLTTIVQDFATYWPREPSPVIAIKRPTIGGLNPVPVKPLPDDAHVATPLPQRIYTGCGTSKGCFGLPAGCVKSNNCQMVVTWYPNPKNASYMKFGLGGRVPVAGSNMGHVSVGFSSDEKMGSDSVVGCVLQNGKVHAKAYYNLPGIKQNSMLKPEQQDLVESENYGDYQDGFVFCEFEKPVKQAGKDPIGQDFDLGKEPYYLLLARSATVYEAKVGYHMDPVKDKGVSQEAAVLGKYKGVLDSEAKSQATASANSIQSSVITLILMFKIVSLE